MLIVLIKEQGCQIGIDGILTYFYYYYNPLPHAVMGRPGMSSWLAPWTRNAPCWLLCTVDLDYSSPRFAPPRPFHTSPPPLSFFSFPFLSQPMDSSPSPMFFPTVVPFCKQQGTTLYRPLPYRREGIIPSIWEGGILCDIV